jgi:speckle-type POZ protein
VDGNLTIDVDMQVHRDESLAFRPKTTLPLDMIQFLESANQSGDVKLQVGTVKFSAHLHLLKTRAPELAALANGYPSDTLIPIQGIKPSTFRSLLHFVYADDVPKPEDFQKEARELLDVADRFGCKGLKLLAEAELVESGITVDTAADLIILGDAKNCALLKEAAMNFLLRTQQ